MSYSTVASRLAWIALAALWVYAIITVMQMPTTVPIHFDANNQPDNFGSRYTYLVMPAIATAILGFFELIKRYPQHMNYPVAITPANQARQQELAFGLLSTIGLMIPIIFFYVIYSTNEYIRRGSMEFSIVLFLSVIFLPIIIYFYLARKAR